MTEIRSNLYRLARHHDWETRIIMGDDPRLPEMPKAPTLFDFFRHRFMFTQHLLQSARLALQAGHDEKVITACLLHDVAVCGFIRGDHGYWGEQMIAPYVDEEVAWAVRTHQALRFYPDESVGYTYPEAYKNWFDEDGEDYQPDAYIEHEYQQALNHKWYMTSRLVTLNDHYSFDPDVVVEMDEFTDLLGRNFHQPVEGLGFDNSPCAHLWRTIIRPNKFL
jgi:hypothetical protein